MKGYELYTFLLCLIVFIFLVSFFTVLFIIIIKSNIKLIKHGVEDERILKEHHEKTHRKRGAKILDAINSIFSYAVTVFFVVIFGLSFYLNNANNKPVGNLPVARVVQSDSMSFKNEENKYLFENNLNNQFETFDIIFTYKLPEEKDLKLYDIVVYEKDNKLIVHRIVGIEEPCSTHPDSRYFLLQGDAIQYPDVYPVEYDQMRAIYTGENIKFVGSFVVFLQSPVGWLCLLLIFANIFITPLITKRLEGLEEERVEYLLFVDKLGNHGKEYDKGIDVISKDDLFNKSFEKKLVKADQFIKKSYSSIKEKLMSIPDIKVYRNRKNEVYTLNRMVVCKLEIKGNKFNIYLNLRPEEYTNTKYLYKSVETNDYHRKTPMLIRLNNEYNVQNAKELISEFASKCGYSNHKAKRKKMK